MEKQTAVEFLVGQITDSTMPVREAIKQAKSMEQQQIKDAYYEGRVKGFDEGCKYTAEN
jgi:hypothetical protein